VTAPAMKDAVLKDPLVGSSDGMAVEPASEVAPIVEGAGDDEGTKLAAPPAPLEAIEGLMDWRRRSSSASKATTGAATNKQRTAARKTKGRIMVKAGSKKKCDVCGWKQNSKFWARWHTCYVELHGRDEHALRST